LNFKFESFCLCFFRKEKKKRRKEVSNKKTQKNKKKTKHVPTKKKNTRMWAVGYGVNHSQTALNGKMKNVFTKYSDRSQ
jgi:hypothetical protein